MSEPESKPKKTSDLLPRLAVAIVAVPLLLWLAFSGPNWGLWLLISSAAAIGTHELYTMLLQRDLRASGWFGVAGTFAILSAFYWDPNPAWLFATVVVVTLGLLIIELTTLRDVSESGHRIASLLAGFVYLSVLFGGLLLLVSVGVTERSEVGPDQAGWFIFPLVTIWSGDTGAYFAGRAFGKHKLAPRVSPGKTIEGAAGGLLASVVGAYIVCLTLLPQVELWQVVVFALPGALLGQIGDLVESLIKRSTGFKDSGTILYGHGGMLDRVDALLFAAPYFAVIRLLLEL